MLQVDHTSKKELDILALDLQHTPENIQEKVLNEVFLTGLIVDPRVGPKIAQKLFGRERFFSIVIAAARKKGDLRPIWEGVLNYMANGQDEWDETSAGGWGASELCTFAGILERQGYEPSPLFVNFQRARELAERL